MSETTCPLYVVSTKRRTDRHTFMRSQLGEQACLFSFDIDRDYDGATGHDDWGVYQTFDWLMTSSNTWWNRELKWGEVGCFLAHLACWRHAAKTKGLEYAIIFEDDAFIVFGLVQGLRDRIEALNNLDPQWDLLYLGRKPRAPDLGREQDFVRPGYSYMAHAYVLSANGLAKLLAYEPQFVVMPVDEFLPATFCTHPRPDVAAAIEPSLRAYAVPENMVTFVSKAIFGSDTESSRPLSA